MTIPFERAIDAADENDRNLLVRMGWELPMLLPL
jgi:hypothetical protein